MLTHSATPNHLQVTLYSVHSVQYSTITLSTSNSGPPIRTQSHPRLVSVLAISRQHCIPSDTTSSAFQISITSRRDPHSFHPDHSTCFLIFISVISLYRFCYSSIVAALRASSASSFADSSSSTDYSLSLLHWDPKVTLGPASVCSDQAPFVFLSTWRRRPVSSVQKHFPLPVL